MAEVINETIPRRLGHHVRMRKNKMRRMYKNGFDATSARQKPITKWKDKTLDYLKKEGRWVKRMDYYKRMRCIIGAS